MKYKVPLLLNEQKELSGFFSANTSQGEIVVVFSNQAKWKRFSDPVSRLLRANGQYLGSFDLEAESFEALIEQLTELHPEVLNEGTFIPDSSPIVEDIIAFFTETAA